MKTITKHYIDRAFVDSHGHEVMEIVNPINGEVVVRVLSALLSGSPTNWGCDTHDDNPDCKQKPDL